VRGRGGLLSLSRRGSAEIHPAPPENRRNC
jgi:hypothetical protein